MILRTFYTNEYNTTAFFDLEHQNPKQYIEGMAQQVVNNGMIVQWGMNGVFQFAFPASRLLKIETAE